ncbi:MAG: type I secretion system permease/ATPase [Hyphomicrobiales bacterium]
MSDLPLEPKRDEVAGAFRAFRRAFAILAMVSFVINLLMLTGPMFMLQVYDRVLASGSIPTLVGLIGLVVILYGFFGILDALRNRILSRIGQNIDERLSGGAFHATVLLSVRAARFSGRVEPLADLERIRQFLASPGPAAIYDVPWLPFYLFVVFLLHPVLGLLGLAGAALLSALILVNERASRQPVADLGRLTGLRNTFIEGVRDNGEAIFAMGMFGDMYRFWQKRNDAFLEVQRDVSDRAGFYGSLIRTIRFLMQSLVLGAGAWLAVRGAITPGVIVAGSIITSRALAPIEQAVAQWRNFLAARQGLARLKKVLELTAEAEPTLRLPPPTERIIVDNAAIAPPGAQMPLIQGTSFTLKAGDGLGIIGPSGSGKSTLARGLIGVWPAVRGSIRLDGSEFGHWSRIDLGRSIGYLPQDVELFDGTVADNIARFDREASADAVIAAARIADVHDLVARLPEGYNTRIGMGGMMLSAGQRQRIGLARALYGNPFLVVLDEPNAHLDAEGEQALTEAIRATRARGAIVIVIAHRPNALAAVDQVMFVKDGRQGAFGPKDEVLAAVTKNRRPPGLAVVESGGRP